MQKWYWLSFCFSFSPLATRRTMSALLKAFWRAEPLPSTKLMAMRRENLYTRRWKLLLIIVVLALLPLLLQKTYVFFIRFHRHNGVVRAEESSCSVMRTCAAEDLLPLVDRHCDVAPNVLLGTHRVSKLNQSRAAPLQQGLTNHGHAEISVHTPLSPLRWRRPQHNSCHPLSHPAGEPSFQAGRVVDVQRLASGRECGRDKAQSDWPKRALGESRKGCLTCTGVQPNSAIQAGTRQRSGFMVRSSPAKQSTSVLSVVQWLPDAVTQRHAAFVVAPESHLPFRSPSFLRAWHQAQCGFVGIHDLVHADFQVVAQPHQPLPSVLLGVSDLRIIVAVLQRARAGHVQQRSHNGRGRRDARLHEVATDC